MSRKGIREDELQPADPETDSDTASEKEDGKPWIEGGDFEDGPDLDPQDTKGARMPPLSNPEVIEDITAGWKDDEFSMTFTSLVLEEAQSKYEKARNIMSPEDPRMKMLDSALWTYILKVLGIIDKVEDAKLVNDILERLSTKNIWKEFRGLLMKSKTHKLNQKEWKSFASLIESCAGMLLNYAAHATVCTIAQLANEWAKDVKYDWIIVDEGTRMSEA